MSKRRCTHLVPGLQQDRLTLVLRIPGHGRAQACWLCKCACGAEAIVREPKLASRHTKSCGCLKRELAAKSIVAINRTHGLTVGGSVTPEYNAWMSMRRRCGDPGVENYALYGGRGISVCQRWDSSFENFLADMGSRPSADHSLDRIDNNGNYTPENCRWADRSTQANNRRTTIQLPAFGETKGLRAWASDVRCVVAYKMLLKRVSAGWNGERAITELPHSRRLKAWTGKKESDL